MVRQALPATQAQGLPALVLARWIRGRSQQNFQRRRVPAPYSEVVALESAEVVGCHQVIWARSY